MTEAFSGEDFFGQGDMVVIVTASGAEAEDILNLKHEAEREGLNDASLKFPKPGPSDTVLKGHLNPQRTPSPGVKC